MPEVNEKVVTTTELSAAVVTTGETVMISSGPVKVPTQTCLVHVRAWAQLTTGAGTTAVIPRIRQGTTITGAIVGSANPEEVKVTAGGTEPFVMSAIEGQSGQDTVEYSFTLQQVGATANGTRQQAAIEVEILSG